MNTGKKIYREQVAARRASDVRQLYRSTQGHGHKTHVAHNIVVLVPEPMEERARRVKDAIVLVVTNLFRTARKHLA